ncbi:MAG TPA: DUF2807 domain-containing protein [Chloroflexi bacterium]|nr:DUF2807 domain-containing protein [Chloroflexota bacterium]HHW89251.1 DUF2807 domain-containing protein [Chloroflexota bacterium]
MKWLLFWLTAFVVVAVALAAGWVTLPGAITGSGRIVTEEVAVASFDRIMLATPGELRLVQGDIPRLQIRADDNVRQALEITAQDGVLMLRTKPDVALLHKMTLVYEVTAPMLRSLTVAGSGNVTAAPLTVDAFALSISGSGDVTLAALNARRAALEISGSGDLRIDQLAADTVEAMVSGSGAMQLAGRAQEASLRLDGSGAIDASALAVSDASVDASGSSDAVVWAQSSLNVAINGSAAVHYYGEPDVMRAQGRSEKLIALGARRN